MLCPCKGCINSGTIHTRCDKYYKYKKQNEEIAKKRMLNNITFNSSTQEIKKERNNSRRKTMFTTHKDWSKAHEK